MNKFSHSKEMEEIRKLFFVWKEYLKEYLFKELRKYYAQKNRS